MSSFIFVSFEKINESQYNGDESSIEAMTHQTVRSCKVHANGCFARIVSYLECFWRNDIINLS